MFVVAKLGPIKKIGKWAGEHKPLAIGGGAILGTTLLAGLVLGSIPLYRKFVKPRLEQFRKKGSGRVTKRSADDELLDELISDPEFMEFLENFEPEFEL